MMALRFSPGCCALLAVAAVAAWPAHAADDARDVAAQLERAEDALNAWQIDDAALIAADLEKNLPDVPPVQEIIGAVKFHQGDYAGAVRFLRRAAEGGQTPVLLNLAESTQRENANSVAMESAHFIIRVPPGKDEVLQPIALAALEKAFTALTAAFDYVPRHKIPVDVLHDPKGLASVSSLTEKDIETSGTIALCKYNRLMITSPKALARGYPWLDTLAHELSHLLISEKSHNTVPIWLHEGLAKYNETRWRGAPGLALEPAAENLLASALKKDHLITFEQMHPSMAKLPSQEDAALAFAEVFTVIEMLETQTAQFPARGGTRPTNVLLESLRDTDDMDRALGAALHTDLKGLQRTWRAYLKTRPFKLVPGAQPRTLTFVKNARTGAQDAEEQEDEAALSEASNKNGRNFVRLANMLREKRRLRAAAVEYEKARAIIGTRSPALFNRWAGVLLEIGDVEKAQKVLQESAAVFADDPQTLVLLGRVALRQERYADARASYEHATWEMPFNPEIYAALHVVGTKTSDAPLVEQATHALQLLAGDLKSAGGFPALARGEAPHGTLDLSSDPWGRIVIDGVETGLLTPVVDLPLVPGPHRIRVDSPVDGRTQGVAVEIKEGETVRQTLTLLALSDQARAALLAAERALVESTLKAPERAPPVGPTAPAPGDEPTADAPREDDGIIPE